MRWPLWNNDFAQHCQSRVKLIGIKCKKNKVDLGTWKQSGMERHTLEKAIPPPTPTPTLPPLAFLNFKGVWRTQATWPLGVCDTFYSESGLSWDHLSEASNPWGPNRENISKIDGGQEGTECFSVCEVSALPSFMRSCNHRQAFSFLLSLGSIYLLQFF